MARGARRQVWMEWLEDRRLLSFDLAFVDAVTTPGVYQPGQTISVDFTFANNGTVESPQTRYFLYLATDEFINGRGGGNEGDEYGVLAGYGGLLFDAPDGLPLAPIGPGQRVPINLTLPVGGVVFNGGPYFIFVIVGLDDPTLALNDSDFSNNFGQSSQAQITIVNGFDPFNPGGGIVPEPVVGRLDPDFGDDGSGVATSTVEVPNLQTLATVFDPVGNVQYALASTGGGGEVGAGLALLRFGNDGRLDLGFGEQGVLALPVATGGSGVGLLGASLLRSDDGALFVTANTALGALVAKFTSVGTFDARFGVNGVVSGLSVSGGAAFTANSLLMAPNGGVYLLGSVGDAGRRDLAVLRIGADGNPDPAFGSAGSVVLDLGGDDVASVGFLQADGALVMAGSSGSRLAAVRVSGAGVRDLRFGTRGTFLGNVRAGFDERFTTAAAGLKGAIYLGGYSATADGSGSSAFVLRLGRTGRPEAPFGRRGIALLDVGSPLASVNTLVGTPDGGVLVAAQFASSLSDAAAGRLGAALVRLEGRGRLVTTFGENGVARVFEPGVGPAAAGDAGEFADFVATREGAVASVPGGRVRSLASDPGATSSTVRVAQLVADGADVAPLFTRPVASSLRPGARANVQVQVSNLGTLPASGAATMSLSLVPVATGPGGGAGGGQVGQATVRVKLNSGQSRNQPVRISVPRTAAGLFTVVARLAPSEALGDIGRSNNTASAPNQVQIGALSARMSGMVLPLSMVRISPPPSEPGEPEGVISGGWPVLPGGVTGGLPGESESAEPGATGELFSEEPVE